MDISSRREIPERS